MRTPAGQLTYCTNIHAGESWPDHFKALRDHFPAIRSSVSPSQPMGIGLRLSNEASLSLVREEELVLFRQWLSQNEAYVFTLNGFPYGGFHRTRVKEQVHAPDWTTHDRVAYTQRLFEILAALLPEGLDGGISTSPLTYRHWFASPDQLQAARTTATRNMLSIALDLIRVRRASGKLLHLDIEPEPDGLLETGAEFIDWFEQDLLPAGTALVAATFSCTQEVAALLLKEHIRLCYDVCHFAIGYEPHRDVIRELARKGIKIGKIQISAALKALMADPKQMPDTPGQAPDQRSYRAAVKQAFTACNEPVYLHQVVARLEDGSLLRYPDLPQALTDFDHPLVEEWRAHFHVPIFVKDFGILQSTRQDIREVLDLQKEQSLTQHLEIETYTWEVLPDLLKLPLEDSIIRELQWVRSVLENTDLGKTDLENAGLGNTDPGNTAPETKAI